MSELIFTKTGINALSGNAIEFECAISPYNYATQKETTFLVITIAEETSKGSGNYNPIKSQKVFPNDQGLLSIDVSSIVDAYLQYFTPPAVLDQLIELPYCQCKKFSVKFSLFNSTTLVTEETKYITPIKAGASYLYFNSDLTYRLTDPDADQLLLHITDEKDKVHVEDIFFLFFTMSTTAAKTVFARYNINYLLDGIISTATGSLPGVLTVPTQLSIACLPAGFNQLNMQSLIPANAIAIDYTIAIVQVVATVETSYLDPINFKIDQRNFYDTVQLVYRNSLGGLHPIRLLGQIDTNADYALQGVTKIAPPSYVLEGNILGQEDQGYNEEDEKFSGETGFITKYQADRMRDFFLSKQRYEIVDGRLVPIILNAKTVKFYTNKDNLFSLQIDWQRGYTNNFFSNSNLPPDVCPSLNTLAWRQSGISEIMVYWSFPFGRNYGRISVLFPGQPLQYYYLEGNSGIKKVVLTRPAGEADTDIDIVVTGNVICNRYNQTPSFGPNYIIPATTLYGEIAIIVINDTYTISGGYISAVTLSPATLANDYDPGGSALEVIAASGATTAGGTYTINAAGVIAYTPPSSGYSGADTFTYQARRTSGGTAVTGTVTINVGAVVAMVYAKIILRNVSGGTAEVWIDFFSNPAGSISTDITGLGLTLNYNKKVEVTSPFSPSITDTPLSIAGTGLRVMVYSGIIEEMDFDGTPIYTTFQMLPGSGYTAI